MRTAAVILFCAFSALAWQDPPKPQQAQGGRAAAAGDLEGFRAIHQVWPSVATNLPDGKRITVSALVRQGRAYQFRVTGDPAQIAEPFLRALKQWRFSMPGDATLHVRFTVTWIAQGGKFVVEKSDIGLN